MKRGLIFLIFVFVSLFALGETTNEKAATAYKSGNYEEALSLYQSLLLPGEQSSDVYYNMGNCYYRLGEMAQSVLFYERALLLDPSNGDVKANLNLAKSKCPDKIDEVGEIFPLRALHWLENSSSSNGWAVFSIVCVFVFLLFFFLFFFGNSIVLRKVGFWCAGVFLFLIVVSSVFSYAQAQRLKNRNDAIILAGSVTVRSTPAENGNALVVAHEGVKVRILSELDGWWEVRLPNGTVGWMKEDNAERI